jgi:hypothetical protein
LFGYKERPYINEVLAINVRPRRNPNDTFVSSDHTSTMNNKKESASKEALKSASEFIRVPGLAAIIEEMRAKYPALSENSLRRILGLPVLKGNPGEDDTCRPPESEVNR